MQGTNDKENGENIIPAKLNSNNMFKVIGEVIGNLDKKKACEEIKVYNRQVTVV